MDGDKDDDSKKEYSSDTELINEDSDLNESTDEEISTGRLWDRKLIRPPKRGQITSPISDV